MLSSLMRGDARLADALAPLFKACSSGSNNQQLDVAPTSRIVISTGLPFTLTISASIVELEVSVLLPVKSTAHYSTTPLQACILFTLLL